MMRYLLATIISKHVRGNIDVLQQITEDVTKEPISSPCIKGFSPSSTCFIDTNLRALQTLFQYHEEWVANTHEKIPSRVCYAHQVYALHQPLEFCLF